MKNPTKQTTSSNPFQFNPSYMGVIKTQLGIPIKAIVIDGEIFIQLASIQKLFDLERNWANNTVLKIKKISPNKCWKISHNLIDSIPEHITYKFIGFQGAHIASIEAIYQIFKSSPRIQYLTNQFKEIIQNEIIPAVRLGVGNVIPKAEKKIIEDSQNLEPIFNGLEPGITLKHHSKSFQKEKKKYQEKISNLKKVLSRFEIISDNFWCGWEEIIAEMEDILYGR